MAFKQAPRKPTDGPVSINRLENEDLVLNASTDGKIESLTTSPYNASRLFGMLALFLEIPLSKAVGKAIKFGDEVDMGIGPGQRSAPEVPNGDNALWLRGEATAPSGGLLLTYQPAEGAKPGRFIFMRQNREITASEFGARFQLGERALAMVLALGAGKDGKTRDCPVCGECLDCIRDIPEVERHKPDCAWGAIVEEAKALG